MNSAALCIFCDKFQDNTTETLKVKRAFGDYETMSRAQVFRWNLAFVFGCRVTVNEELCSGRPITARTEENVSKVRGLVNYVNVRRYDWSMIGYELKVQ